MKTGQLQAQYSDYLNSVEWSALPEVSRDYVRGKSKYSKSISELKSELEMVDMKRCPKYLDLGATVYQCNDGRVCEIGEPAGATMASRPVVAFFDDYDHWFSFRQPMSFRRYHERY